MRVGISAEFIGTIKCGIASHTQNLLYGLSRLETEHRFYPYLAAAKARTLMPVAANIRPRLVRPYSAWLRVPLMLPAELMLRPVDLFNAASGWAPPWCPAPFVATIHDLLFEKHPESYTRAMRWRLRWLVRATASRAVRVITVSHTSAADLVRLYGVPVGKIRVIHNALDPDLAPVVDPDLTARVRARYGIGGPYILYLGVVEPKKNVDQLLRAYAVLRRERGIPHRLVIAGRAGWLSGPILRLVASLGLERDVVLPGEVPQEDVAALYSGASVFAYLSSAEGFGYPPLEAAACGTPVLASDATALKEVLGDAALMVDPLRLDEVVGGLSRLLVDDTLRGRLRARGLGLARQFQAEAAARQVVAVYEEAYAEIQAARTVNAGTASARKRRSKHDACGRPPGR